MRILVVCLLLAVAKNAFAFEWQKTWQSLWQTSDQQGMALLKQGKSEEAGMMFDNNDWQGISQYRADNFEQAIESLGQSESSEAHYNRANALARAGKLQEALDAYGEQLALGDNEDARFNRELVEKLIKQQSQNQSSDSDDKNNSDSKNQQDKNQQQSADETGNSNKSEEDKQSDDAENEAREGEQESSDKKTAKGKSDKKQDETEQNVAQKADESKENKKDPETKASAASSNDISEDEQAMQQWLNRIPDDPADLLRRKLRLKHQLEYAGTGDGEKPW